MKDVDLIRNTKLASIYLHSNTLEYLVLWFNPSMPWNYKDGKYGLFLYNQYSLRCRVTFIFNQELEKTCRFFLQKGKKGFGLAKAEEGWYNNYWENRYNC